MAFPASTAPATTALRTGRIVDLVARCAEDPWALTAGERSELLLVSAPAQVRWLPRLRALVEPPLPAPDFPAFLLDLPAYAHLRQAVAVARSSGDLDVATADELQRFVDHYREWAAGQPAALSPSSPSPSPSASARPSGWSG
jgi:hypothetical protein